MLINDMLGNYNQVSQHQANPAEEASTAAGQAQQTNALAKRSANKTTEDTNQASVVNISFEAQMMRKQADHIMINYDLQNISQNKLDHLTEQLLNSEAITSQDYAVLSFHSEQIFDSNASENGELNMHPDQSQNMLSKWQEKLTDHKTRNSNPLAIKQTQGIVNLLNNLQASRDMVIWQQQNGIAV